MKSNELIFSIVMTFFWSIVLTIFYAIFGLEGVIVIGLAIVLGHLTEVLVKLEKK